MKVEGMADEWQSEGGGVWGKGAHAKIACKTSTTLICHKLKTGLKIYGMHCRM